MDINFCGAQLAGDICTFRVWAPEKKEMHVVLENIKAVPMKRDADGYFIAEVKDVAAGTRYKFSIENSGDYPDPASYYQPDGVHGPSAVVNHEAFEWTDGQWRGISFRQLIIYELHVGTFTDAGTFDAIIPRLDALYDLGVNAIQLMPVSQFPGNRNWGYDGTYPYAVQNSYGGPDGLKRLVNACHEKGISVILDVVYNHLGPEGNYFRQFGPYFTKNYSTPWGDAINFDTDYADGVRDFFCHNALYWFKYFHLDGLRLDAIHMAFDNSAQHFWQYVNENVKAYADIAGRPLHMIAESDLNSPRVISPPAVGGYDFTAQWLDDFHHALYVLIDPKGKERYYDFGSVEQLAKAYTDGFVHSGEYVKFRKRKYGASSAGISGNRFVVFNLNHDQVGNRPLGERLCMIVDDERLKVAAAAILLAPYIPMLFMGEEYADRSPFYYFISHSDPVLIEAVRKGRKEEFKGFATQGEPPDAQDEETFNASKLQWNKRENGNHKTILEWHKQLLQLRRDHPALKNFDKNDVRVYIISDRAIVLHRRCAQKRNHLLALFNFGETESIFVMPSLYNNYELILTSKDSHWTATNAGKTKPTVNATESVTLSPISVLIYQSSDNH